MYGLLARHKIYRQLTAELPYDDIVGIADKLALPLANTPDLAWSIVEECARHGRMRVLLQLLSEHGAIGDAFGRVFDYRPQVAIVCTEDVQPSVEAITSRRGDVEHLWRVSRQGDPLVYQAELKRRLLCCDCFVSVLGDYAAEDEENLHMLALHHQCACFLGLPLIFFVPTKKPRESGRTAEGSAQAFERSLPTGIVRGVQPDVWLLRKRTYSDRNDLEHQLQEALTDATAWVLLSADDRLKSHAAPGPPAELKAARQRSSIRVPSPRDSASHHRQPAGEVTPHRSLWNDGLFWLFAFAVVFSAVGTAAGLLPTHVFLVVSGTSLALLGLIGALLLRARGDLSEASFIRLVLASYKRTPPMRWLSRRQAGARLSAPGIPRELGPPDTARHESSEPTGREASGELEHSRSKTPNTSLSVEEDEGEA